MIYPRMKTERREEVTFPTLNTGVDSRPYARNIGDHALDVGENVWWQEDALSTRPSLRLKNRITRYTGGTLTRGAATDSSANALWWEIYTEYGTAYLSAFRLDGEGRRVDELPPLAASKGTITPFGDGYLAVTDTGVFRLPAGETAWQDVIGFAYVPIVMRHGRGCSTEEPRPMNGEEYEEPNRLTDWFRASYTTDGVSHRFYLPVSGLKSEKVTAQLVNEEGRTKTYIIPASATVSPVIDGRIMQVDRSGGYVQFVDAEGMTMPPAAAVREDNLVITAAKTGFGGGDLLTGMSQAVWWQADEHRSLLMLSGKADDPSLVCWLQPGEWYLPKSRYTHIGDPHSGVTAMIPFDGRLLLFKERALYQMTVSSAEGADLDRLSVTLYPSAAGCDGANTIAVEDDRVIWLDTDGRVRRLTGSHISGRRAPDVLSEVMGDTLSAITSVQRGLASAVYYKGHYLLRLGNVLWVLNDRQKEPVWHCWTVDERLKSAKWAMSGGRLDWLCTEAEQDTPIWAVYTLADDGKGEDRLWLDGAVVTKPIPFKAETKWWNGDTLSDRYRVSGAGVEASLAGERLHLSISTENQQVAVRLTDRQMKGGRLPLRLSRFRWLRLKLSGQGYLRWHRLRLTRQTRQGGRG